MASDCLLSTFIIKVKKAYCTEVCDNFLGTLIYVSFCAIFSSLNGTNELVTFLWPFFFQGDVPFDGDEVLDYEEFRGLGGPIELDHHKHSG